MRRPFGIATLFVATAVVSGCASGIVTKPPSDVTETSATVNGIVWTTDGGEVSYWVEYGNTGAYDRETTHQTAYVAEDKPHDVLIPLTGLTASTTWHYRLCAEDAQAGTCSADAILFTGDSVVGEAIQCAGGVEPPCPFLSKDRLRVDAHSTANGEAPSGTLETVYASGRGAPIHSLDVTCLHVADNVAIIGGLGEHFGAIEEDHYPVAAVIRVTDGGGPGSAQDAWEFLES